MQVGQAKQLKPFTTTSLEEVWQAMSPLPPGVLSQLDPKEQEEEVSNLLFIKKSYSQLVVN